MSELESHMPLAKGSMPPCWSDDVRMTSLFAPFRLRSLNPTDYEAKMKFWTEMICKWCQQSGSFSYDDIKSAFQRKGKYPACLDTVMEQMIADRALVEKSSVQPYSQGWIGWGARQLVRPAVWAASSLLSSKASALDRQKKFVHLESLKNQSLAFLSSVPDELKIGSLEELKTASTLMASRTHVGDSMELMMNWLQSQNLATCSTDGQLFKLALDPNTKVKPLTEGEICLPRLEKAKKHLEASIENMNEKSSAMRLSAKICLTRGDRTGAMGHLRQKKLLEIRMEKAANSHESISHLVDSVRQAHSDSEIYDAFRTGLGALKITMRQTGLEENNVMDTMDDIKDCLDTYSGIEEAISQPLGMTFDRDELEQELRDLVASGGAADAGSGGAGSPVGKEDLFPTLPVVPDTEINTKIDIKVPANSNSIDFHTDMEKRLKNLRVFQKF